MANHLRTSFLMRNNGPITEHEIELQDEQLLISRTDVNSRIVVVNPDFVEISGHSEVDLIGQPHNIVRHPDMPAAVFADLWRDLQSGRQWVGLIKNRCKNGDYYWAEAHVSPLRDGGQLTGYMSMRRKASPEQIASAEADYATLQDPNRTDLTFEHGKVIRRRTWGKVCCRLGDTSLGTKFLTAALLAAAVILLVATYIIATQVTKTLDERNRKQLTHDVTLLRAAVSSRIENANIEAGEHAKILTELINQQLGGHSKASQKSLEAILDNETRNSDIARYLKNLRGAGTLFVLTPKGFQRRLSTALDEQGQPATGTFLAADHPAIEALLAGKSYVGPARVFGRYDITRYTPLFDHAGAVIGASGIGIDIDKQLAPLKEQIRTLHIGSTGYYYIVDATPGEQFGQLILHPFKEGKRLTDYRTEETSYLLSEMLRMKQGEVSYTWQNEEMGETFPHRKQVIFETMDMPRWIIAGGTTTEEFSALTKRIVLAVILGGLLLVGAMLATVLILLRKVVLEPLNQQVLPTFQAISAGRFDTPLDIRGSDEIGQLIHGL